MTVAELRNMLSDYDGETEVMIGMYQRYGSDFAYALDEIEDTKSFSAFFGGDNDDVIFLLEGEQIGVIADKEDEYDE